MKVMLVAPYFPPEVTGSSNFVADLADGLSSAGHEVLVVTANENATLSPKYAVEVLKARRVKPGRIAFDYTIPLVLGRSNVSKLRSLFDTFKPDVVSVHGQIFDITIMAARMAHKRGIPTTMTVHSAIWHDNPLFNVILWLGDTALARLFLKPNINAWIGVDDRTVSHTRDVYKEECATIPVCIRRGAFKNGNAEAARNKYNITGHPVIASIGHVVPVRNRVPLVEALPDILKTYPELQVVIVGRVADSEYMERARELGVDQHIHSVGAVPHADIADVIAAAQLEVHDLQGYGLGIASLEPMDAGVPVIAYVRNDNLPGVNLRDYSEDAFLTDNYPNTLSKAIISGLSDAAFKQRVVTGQQRLIDEVYSQETVVAKYVSAFAEASAALNS